MLTETRRKILRRLHDMHLERPSAPLFFHNDIVTSLGLEEQEYAIEVQYLIDEGLLEPRAQVDGQPCGLGVRITHKGRKLIESQVREQEQAEKKPASAIWDVFICHASEDKDAIAGPLADALSRKGLKIWYDEFTLKLGDSLRRSINSGLAQSRYGVVILSPDFFAKEWPQRELDGLAALEVDGEKKILPVWHNVTRENVARFSPILADRLAVSTLQGIDTVVDKILRVVRPVQVDDIGPHEISDTGKMTILERFRKVLALQHELEILLLRVHDGLQVERYQGVDTLVPNPGSQRDYDQLLETYRIWELSSQKLFQERAPEHKRRLARLLAGMRNPLYLRLPYPTHPERWFDIVKKPLRDIGVLIKELGKELTISIPSELPYDFMEHFYDPSTQWQAASPGHIRLLQKAECSHSAHPAIFEHPPKQGDAILTYHLRGLPALPANFRLYFRYGVIDKLYEEPSGALIEESDFRSIEGNHVMFSIRVDGKEIFRSPQYGHEWSPPIEKGPLEAPNGNLAVEFRTNAIGEPRGNWAAWGEPRLVEVKATSSAAGPEGDTMATEESTWQITYLDCSESELFPREVWIGRFLVVWDDGREEQVKVELSEELVTNIESKWPEIDADPESLIRTLGARKIDTQLRQQGQVEKVVRLYSKQYPGYPGRPDV